MAINGVFGTEKGDFLCPIHIPEITVKQESIGGITYLIDY